MINFYSNYIAAFRSLGLLYFIGDRAYEFALKINSIYNWWRKLFGFKYWSLSSYLKTKVKGAMQAVSNFEELVVRKCIDNNCDMLMYGHTHCPGIKHLKDKILLNTGDAVENFTTIVETLDGEFRVIRLAENIISDRI